MTPPNPRLIFVFPTKKAARNSHTTGPIEFSDRNTARSSFLCHIPRLTHPPRFLPFPISVSCSPPLPLHFIPLDHSHSFLSLSHIGQTQPSDLPVSCPLTPLPTRSLTEPSHNSAHSRKATVHPLPDPHYEILDLVSISHSNPLTSPFQFHQSPNDTPSLSRILLITYLNPGLHTYSPSLSSVNRPRFGTTLHQRSPITDSNFPISLAPLNIAIETLRARPFTHEQPPSI